MSNTINLRQARKERDRRRKAEAASQNAARHGQSKLERTRTEQDLARAKSKLDAHKRESGDDGN